MERLKSLKWILKRDGPKHHSRRDVQTDAAVGRKTEGLVVVKVAEHKWRN